MRIYVDWNQMSWDRAQWLAAVSMVLDFQISQKAGDI
jgi:hypothetical protein